MSQRAFIPPWQTAGMPKETPVLIALSGGADSAALLRLLSERAARDGFSILAAHLHHGIRGEEAERDAMLSERLAARFGAEFVCERVDVPRLARESGRGLEETARAVRYDFFARLMRERRIPILVTAHHANDNLETLLFRIARGTGLRGLCGIPEKRDFAGGVLVRPLLAYSKRELVELCLREEIPFAQDSTNLLDGAARNRIRHGAIPSLETVAADPTASAYRLTRALAQDEDCLSSMAEALLAAHLRNGRMPVEPLLRAHPAIRARALLRLCEGGADAVHLEALGRLLQTGRSGASCPLPGDLCACLQGGALMILPKLRVPLGREEIPFFEGCRAFCDGRLTVFVKRLENSESRENVHNLSTSASIIIDGNFEPDQLFFRARREGDTLLRGGKHQRLGRLFAEAEVPAMLRDSLPILCDGEGILWVPFVGLRDGARQAQGACLEICVTVHKNTTEQKGLDYEFTQQ